MFTNYKKRLIAAIVLFSTLTTPVIQTNFYSTIGKASLRAESAQNQETKETKQSLGLATEETAVEKVDLTVKTLTADEQLKLWFNLLEHTYENKTIKRVISDDVAEKLNLLSGSGQDSNYCLRTILPTTTIVGEAGAAEELATGTNGLRNQSIVRYFTENPSVANRTAQALIKIDNGMGLYLTFFKEVGKAEKEVFDSVFFGSWLGAIGANKSIVALSILRLIQRGLNNTGFLPLSTMGIVPKHFIQKALECYKSEEESFIKKYQSLALETPQEIVKDIVLSEYHSHNPQGNRFNVTTIRESNDYKNHPERHPLTDEQLNNPTINFSQEALHGLYNGEYDQYIKEADGDQSKHISLGDRSALMPHNVDWRLRALALYGPVVLVDAINLYRMYSTYQNIKFDTTILENLQLRLMGVASIVEGLAEINAIALESNISELMALTTEINLLLQSVQTSSDLGSMIGHLQTNTFTGEASYFSNRPRILATYTLLQENKAALIPALKAAGTIDALHAAAQLVTQQSGQRAQYSFVEFVDNTKPVLELHNFWNPLIDPAHVVLNSVHLGNGGDYNMLLTGPNGSGKSGNMTGIALSGVILPHAFGIASAEHARVTPFTHINTYLNEREDLQQNLSTFMAEAKKLDTICDQIAQLDDNARCFTIMDEMLKGTVEDAGAELVYEAGLKLAAHQQSIVVMATHFEKPTELEVATDGAFVNYHVGLQEKVEGQFKRTFELVRGANLWWFQDANKRKRFINWLTALNR